jgi:hypothetical protein
MSMTTKLQKYACPLPTAELIELGSKYIPNFNVLKCNKLFSIVRCKSKLKNELLLFPDLNI